MFNRQIVSTDNFLELSAGARLLYLYLIGNADDDGFICNPKSIVRQVALSVEDLKTLIDKEYLISFESGAVAVTHWHQHNLIRKDRYIKTLCIKEKETLSVVDGVYIRKEEKN